MAGLTPLFSYAGAAPPSAPAAVRCFDLEGRRTVGYTPVQAPAPTTVARRPSKPTPAADLPGVPFKERRVFYPRESRAYYPRCQATIRVVLEGSDEVLEYIVVPRSVDLDRNHHRSADTFDMTLDYRDMPLDPRAIRSMLIIVLLGDTGNPVDDLADTEKYRSFIGYVDAPETTLQESGEVVNLKGRDYTSLFLDHRWEGGAINVTVPLRQVVKRILKEVPGALPVFGERVYFVGDTVDDPGGTILSTIIGRKNFIPQAGDDTWTVLVDLCGRAGFVPAMELDNLIIRTPNQVGQVNAELTYGVDVTNLSYNRKLTSAQSKQIEVRCWDDHAAKATVVRYPPKPVAVEARATTSADGKTTVDTTYANIIPFYVQGPYPRNTLEQIARSVYADLAREQIDATVETREMLDSNGAALWLLGNGDKLKINLGKPGASSVQGMSPAEAVLSLVDGVDSFNPTVAQALVDANTLAAGTTPWFYVKSAKHHWDREQGYRLSVNLINMVQATIPPATP